MKSRILFLLAILGLWSIAAITPASSSSTLAITSPQSGEALQGVISITGTTSIEGFASADLYFAYSTGDSPAWFLIEESKTPVTAGELAKWDTTTLTDGTYDLKLVVTASDSTQQEWVVKQVRIRNYTPIETSTLTPQVSQNVVESPSATHPIQPTFINTFTTATLQTPTPLPANPAELTSDELVMSLEDAGIVLAGIFLVGLFYFGVLKRRK